MNVLEYICLDSESKFRSKTVFSTKPIEEIEEVVVDSMMISNVVVESHDIILVPVKCIKNPLIKDDKHWLVMCEIRYPNGSIHKYNTRDPLQNLMREHSDYEVALTQQFVLFNKEKKPIGWHDGIDLMKNYSSKLDYIQHSQEIIDELIENLLYVGIGISNIQMERMVSRWSVTFQRKSVLDACDELFLVRYLLQRLCGNKNVFVSFHPDPIKSSKIYSRCYLKLTSDKMRQENGILDIDRACKKLELKHLEQHKSLCQYNGKHFSYGQNSSRYDVVIHLDTDNSGYLEDKRASGDCDIYVIAEKIIRTIETDYSIDTMSSNLEQLKERFNYKNALNTGITRPIISFGQPEAPLESNKKTTASTTSTSKETPKKEKAKGLSGLARILKLNEDSEDEEESNKQPVGIEVTRNMSRVEEIIHTLKGMSISHNVLQSSSAPKSAASTLKHDAPSNIPDMNHMAVPMDPNQGLGMLQSQQPMMSSQNFQHPRNNLHIIIPLH
ncbi:MAG: hypothetical protein O2827_06530 [Verrucomicrobia bacterium]|nr:hypothetical protein [Verrucomicrobiota bacterium]